MMILYDNFQILYLKYGSILMISTT